MLYFLAISLQADVNNGSFWPSYVLCKTYTTSESRSGYRIVKQLDGIPSLSLPKVLVTELTGHDDLIDFMSSYQTQHKNGKHYHPKGYLCWYEADNYGDPTGTVHIIKQVPEYVWIFNFKDKGYQKMKRDNEKKKIISKVLSAEPRTMPLNTSGIKCKLSQTSHRQNKLKDKKEKKVK